MCVFQLGSIYNFYMQVLIFFGTNAYLKVEKINFSHLTVINDILQANNYKIEFHKIYVIGLLTLFPLGYFEDLSPLGGGG